MYDTDGTHFFEVLQLHERKPKIMDQWKSGWTYKGTFDTYIVYIANNYFEFLLIEENIILPHWMM